MKRRCIAFDKYSNTNFSYFSILCAHPQLSHPRSWIATRLKRHVRRQYDPSDITSPSENWSIPSVVPRHESPRALTSYVHRKRTAPITNTFLPNLSRAPPPTFQPLAPLATRKLAKVAVAVLAENSSLKKIQAITSRSSSEAGGREAVVVWGDECDGGMA